MKRFIKILTIILLAIVCTTAPISIPLLQDTTVQAATVGLNKTKVTVYVGESNTIRMVGTSSTIKWSSNNKSVATVAKGKIVGVKKGTAVITALVGTKKYTCSVTVKAHSISAKTLKLEIGSSKKLSVTGTGSNITWKSSNTSIASVSSSGVVVAKSEGTVKIAGKYNDKSYTCTVTVVGIKLTAEEVYDKCSPSTVQINTDIAIGTGFFIDNNKVVTNYHVIEGATSISVQLQSGKSYEIDSILGYSEEYDIAILRVPVENVPLKMNTHGTNNGETVYAIGSSLGLTGTFTNGIITNESRVIDNVEYIQTNAAITNGNSGGPLLNAYGEVIGINTMQYVDGQNLNFAINIKHLSNINTSSPITPAEFYNANQIQFADMSADIILEDTTISNSKDSCQNIVSMNVIMGSLSREEVDFYRFTLTSTSEVGIIGLPLTSSISDMEKMNIGIFDSNDRLVAVTSLEFVEGELYFIIDQILQAGTYYVAVFPKNELYAEEIPYAFYIAYE